jgi:hypothetical protein
MNTLGAGPVRSTRETERRRSNTGGDTERRAAYADRSAGQAAAAESPVREEQARDLVRRAMTDRYR